MRWLTVGGVALLGSVGSACAAPEPGATPGPGACLSPGEIQDAVSQGRAIEPRTAVQAARRQVPGADVMRGGLCRNGDALVYQVMVLRKDGRLVYVTIDAPSGKVVGVR